MKRNTTCIVTTVMLLLLSVPVVHGQFSIQPGISMMMDDNINNNALQLVDRISTLTLNTGYEWEGERWTSGVAYDGALRYYQSYTDRTNQTHSGTIFSVLRSGPEEENLLSLTLNYGAGVYREDFSLYDHTQFLAALQYKHFLAEDLIAKGGYTFRSIGFSQLGDFSYTEHAASGSMSWALPTMTTIIAQADLGAKFYSAAGTGGEITGRGRAGSTITPGVTQLGGLMRAGQRITDATGLSLTMRYQWNIQKEARYLTSESGNVSDDELFDDHYGYEGLQTSMLLTQILSESMVVKMTIGIQNRSYSSLPAYDTAGNQVSDHRVDERAYLNFLFQKEFDSGCTLKAAFDMIRNVSNDAFYDYRNTALTLEMGVPL